MIAMRMRNFDFCSYFKQLNLESVRQSLMSAFYSVTCFFLLFLIFSWGEKACGRSLQQCHWLFIRRRQSAPSGLLKWKVTSIELVKISQCCFVFVCAGRTCPSPFGSWHWYPSLRAFANSKGDNWNPFLRGINQGKALFYWKFYAKLRSLHLRACMYECFRGSPSMLVTSLFWGYCVPWHVCKH